MDTPILELSWPHLLEEGGDIQSDPSGQIDLRMRCDDHNSTPSPSAPLCRVHNSSSKDVCLDHLRISEAQTLQGEEGLAY